MQEKTIMLGPVRTRYFTAGAENDPTVVLIHEGGFGSDAPNTFGRMAETLAVDHRVVMPEMLGFGGTDKAVFFGEDPYQPRLRHLTCFFEALELVDVHVVGNSFGGGMALRLSIHDDVSWRMRSVTSISGTGGPYRTPEAVKYTTVYTPTMEEARRVDEWVLAPAPADEEHSRARYESSLRPGQWEAMMAHTLRSPVAVAASASDYPESLSKSAIPTLLVAGAHDPIFERGWEDHIAAHLRNVTTARIEGGHAPNITHPVETADLVRDFFRSTTPRDVVVPPHTGKSPS